MIETVQNLIEKNVDEEDIESLKTALVQYRGLIATIIKENREENIINK